MKSPDFSAKCPRCEAVVPWNGGGCCVGGNYPMAHNKQDGTPCLPPPFRIPTSITLPPIKGGWPVLDANMLVSVQPMTGPLAPSAKSLFVTKKPPARRKSK